MLGVAASGKMVAPRSWNWSWWRNVSSGNELGEGATSEEKLELLVWREMMTLDEMRTCLLLAFYVLVFATSLFGNALVIAVVACNKKMRNITNYYLINLAVADLFVTVICMPPAVGLQVYQVWVYGQFLCKSVSYLQGVSIFASVLTITVSSLDRYVAIQYPLSARQISTTSNVRRLLVLVWLLPMVTMLPLAFVRQIERREILGRIVLEHCVEQWPSPFSLILFDLLQLLFVYVVPGTVVAAAYSISFRSLLHEQCELRRHGTSFGRNERLIAGRRRVARLLLVMAAMFALSWLPYYVLIVPISLGKATETLVPALDFALLLGHSHSAQNPILYFILSTSFRRNMKLLVTCRLRQLRRRQTYSSASQENISPAARAERSKRVDSMCMRRRTAEQRPSRSSASFDDLNTTVAAAESGKRDMAVRVDVKLIGSDEV